MGTPIPFVVDLSGAATSAPAGSIPIELYGSEDGAEVIRELQAAIADLTARVVALENP